MEITIKDKTYTLNFGIKALEALDKHYKVEQSGMEIGGGVVYANGLYEMASPAFLSVLIPAGLLTSKTKPSLDDIDEYINSLDMDEYEKLYNDVYENFIKTPRVAYQMQKLMNK